MQKESSLQGKWWNVVFFTTALLVVAADQLSKIWIRSNLGIEQSLFELGFFRITYVQNTGAAFGLFQGQLFALTIVSLVGVVAILAYTLLIHRRSPLNNMLSTIALGLILGGTVGNLIDRLNSNLLHSNLGGVTDFISIGIWPAFNIADSVIIVGTILFAYSLLRLALVKKQ